MKPIFISAFAWQCAWMITCAARGLNRNADGSRADVRFVVTHKGVIPEKDPATRRILQVRSAGEPAIEALAGIMRQRTLPGDPEQFRQDTADDQRIQQAIGDCGRATAPFA